MTKKSTTLREYIRKPCRLLETLTGCTVTRLSALLGCVISPVCLFLALLTAKAHPAWALLAVTYMVLTLRPLVGEINKQIDEDNNL